MNVLKREIEDALAKAAVKPDGIIIKESKYFPLHWYFEKGNEELRDNCLYWLRQLLDENQDLKLRLVRLSKVLSPSASELQALRDENQALQNKIETQKSLNNSLSLTIEGHMAELQAQAKEIEQLKEDRDWWKGHAETRLECWKSDREELQALREDNARYRESLEWYADVSNYHQPRPFCYPFIEVDKGERARKALIGNQEEGI